MINDKQIIKDKIQSEETRKKPYDLEARTLLYAKDINRLCRKLAKDAVNSNIVNQLVRAAASVGANYREARESVSKKDSLHRMRIARKECRESSYWLELLKDANMNIKSEIDSHLKESKELRNILSAIIDKSE